MAEITEIRYVCEGKLAKRGLARGYSKAAVTLNEIILYLVGGEERAGSLLSHWHKIESCK